MQSPMDASDLWPDGPDAMTPDDWRKLDRFFTRLAAAAAAIAGATLMRRWTR